jgi:hypothetical protein
MLPIVVQGCGVGSPIRIHPNHATCDPQILSTYHHPPANPLTRLPPRTKSNPIVGTVAVGGLVLDGSGPVADISSWR